MQILWWNWRNFRLTLFYKVQHLSEKSEWKGNGTRGEGTTDKREGMNYSFWIVSEETYNIVVFRALGSTICHTVVIHLEWDNPHLFVCLNFAEALGHRFFCQTFEAPILPFYFRHLKTVAPCKWHDSLLAVIKDERWGGQKPLSKLVLWFSNPCCCF